MKINRVLIVLLMMAGVSLSSCNKDDDIINPEPTLSFKGGAGYTSTDVTITTGESILVGFNAAYNQETNEKLKNFKLTVTSNNIAQTLIDSALNTEVFSTDITISFPDPASALLQAVVTDDAGRTASVSFNIVVENAGVKVVKYTEVELGSWNDEIGSFYNAQENTIYNVTEAAANQAKVDLVFYKGETNLNTLAAPADESLETILTFDINSWTTRNATMFIGTEMTAEEFDAIGEYYEFPEFVEADADTKIVDMVNGDVVFFKTEADALGYIKVVDLYSRGDLGKFEVIVME
jgi:hypothetical protein